MSFEREKSLTGQTVGEYQVLQRLGVGGMGVVYEGLQPLIGKRVAVKVLLSSLSSDQEIVQRFLSEAKAVNAIRHRGIVDVFSFGTLDDGASYFVMEFLDGVAFDRLIKDRGAQTPYDVLTWAEEILDALDAAHSAGVIHRDIKPSNLFLVNTGRGRSYVKLLDFGIAKLGALNGEATPQTRASAVIGTPDYMSPEQARGRPISAATDLYALGCVLYELLTGQRLFRGENPMQTMFMHVEEEPARASLLAPKVPKQLDDLLLWMLEKDPANRPQSAAELKVHVEELLKVVPSERTQNFVPPPAARSYPASVGSATPASGAGSRRVAPTATPAPTKSEARRSATQPPRPASLDQTRAAPDSLAPIRLDRTAVAKVPLPVPSPEPVSEPDVPAIEDTLPPDRKSKAPLIIGLVALVLVGAGIGVHVDSRGKQNVDSVIVPPPVQRVEPKPEPVAEVKPEPVVEAPKPEPIAEVKPEPVVEPQKPVVPEVKPVRKARVVTADDVSKRLASLEQKLAARDAKSGGRDRVLHQFLDQGTAMASKANSNEDRIEVMKFLAEVQKQLDAK